MYPQGYFPSPQLGYYPQNPSYPAPQHLPPHMQPHMPQTPLDLSYLQLMLPLNLLVSSPYLQSSAQMMSPLDSRFQQPYYPQYNQYQAPKNVHLPYLTPLNSNLNLDQLNLSRTVILRNLDDSLTLNQLLSEIEYGPIEYCKMFSKAAPAHFLDVENLKTCYISFVNLKISVNFHLKYGKNPYNLNKLKERLNNSKYLKVSLNDTTGANSVGQMGNSIAKQDYIKLKTLNYILDFAATRCVLIRICTEGDSAATQLEAEIRAQCAKFGDVEDFKLTHNDQKGELKFLIHFTSIDLAIKTYEFYLKRIQLDKQSQIDHEGDEAVQNSPKFVHVSFHKDRCDRVALDKPKKKEAGFNGHAQFGNIPEETEFPAISHPVLPPELETPTMFPAELAAGNPEGLREFNGPEVGLGTDLEGLVLSVSPNSAHSVISSNAPVENAFPHAPYARFSQSDFHRFPKGPSSVHSAGSQAAPMHNPLLYNPDPFNVGNRAIYLGNLHPNTTIEEIANNVRAGGLVELIKFHPERKVCFITFVDPTIALKFYVNHQVLHQLIIHGYDITVGWAKNHSGPLSREISLAVTAGASRNVYIGIKAAKEGSEKQENKQVLPDEATLRADFSQFGDMEQINFYHNKDCGFMNFLNILDAIRVVELFETGTASSVSKVVGDDGAFYQKYKDFKISFAKDRCGNLPKFSFKKKGASDYKLTFKAFKKKNRAQQEAAVPQDEPKATITEEAAMVFGIISPEKNKENEGPEGKLASSLEDTSLEEKPDLKPPQDANEEEEEDSDDDVSIIIDSDETSFTTVNKEGPRRNQVHGPRNDRKSLRNLLNVSLNLSYMGTHPHQLYYRPELRMQNSNYGYYQPPPQPQLHPLQTFSYQQQKNPYSTSGLQVMAQYLAKSQHDNLLYAASILSNDVGIEEEYYKGRRNLREKR